MKTLLTSVKIWLKTVVFNAVLASLWAIGRDVPAFFIFFLFLIIGLFVSLPLLMLINPLVKLSLRLPYSIAARVAWLFFFLAVLAILIYLLVWAIGQGEFYSLKDTYLLSCCTISALLIAVLTTRKSLIKINTPQE